MKIGSCFPSKYLKASDLPDGQDVRVVISDVTVDAMEQSADEKPVVHFAGKQKGLVLNKTNSATIEAAYGDETENWAGKEVVLFGTSTSFRGKMVPCIRLKVSADAVVHDSLDTIDDPSDDIPF